MEKEWIDRIRKNGAVDQDGYRYRLMDFGDYGEVRRVKLEQAHCVQDIWDWELVEKIKLEDTLDWVSGAISLDGGNTFLDPKEAIGEIQSRRLWDFVLEEMDEEIRDIVEGEEPATECEFLARYLELAQDDIIIG